MITAGYILYLSEKDNKNSNYSGVDGKVFSPPAEYYRMKGKNLEKIVPWMEEAVSIFEKDLVKNDNSVLLSLDLIKTYDTAIVLRKILNEHRINVDILFVRLLLLNEKHNVEFKSFSKDNSMLFLGYDVAYPGGDYYSALLNGLLISNIKTLQDKYSNKLNKNLLFSETGFFDEYVQDFKKIIMSEENAIFVVYEIWRCIKFN